jgi:DNA-binding NtrC family response regulator
LRKRIAQVAPTDVAVLITGENGTGKELVARSIHTASRRATREMISVNCPVLSDHLMESELFGHERGAFTSADAPRVGRFELADGGTIHLDEITEIELKLQAKLLRVLQEKTFERVGASQSVKADVRVLATTNRVLRDEVAAGRFREDLYFRLAVVELEVPPLRQRREDIAELVAFFQTRAAQRLGIEPTQFSESAGELLSSYHWPGNVRELENIVMRACVFAGGKQISADELRPWLIASGETSVDEPMAIATASANVNLNEMERKLIESTLEHFDGHRQKTATALGIGVRTLSGKLRAYGLAPRAKTFGRTDFQSVRDRKAS